VKLLYISARDNSKKNFNTKTLCPFFHFLAVYTSATWFDDLNKYDQNRMVKFVLQGIVYYGDFNQDIKEDMISKFEIHNDQAQQVYDFVYYSRNLFFF